MDAQAAQVSPAPPAAPLTVVPPAAEARARAALRRFEEAIQSVLETPLEVGRVAEWTRLRTLHA